MMSLQIEIAILIVIGYVLSKRGYFSKETRGQLTDIILKLILPCAIINSFQIDLSKELIVSTGAILCISFGIQILYGIFNRILYNSLSEDKKVCCQYSTMVSNAGFMGMPISEWIFGSTGLLYASVFLIPQRIFMWSSGLALFAKNKKENVIKQILTHPCIIALYIGIVLMFLRSKNIFLPKALEETINDIARCNTALSMIVIGGILSEVNIRAIIDKEAIIYSFYRLIMIPIIIYIILKFIPVNNVASNVCVLLSAMPAASTTAMLAQKYNGNYEFASKLIFVSTLFSLITLPIIVRLF